MNIRAQLYLLFVFLVYTWKLHGEHGCTFHEQCHVNITGQLGPKYKALCIYIDIDSSDKYKDSFGSSMNWTEVLCTLSYT